MARPKKPVNEEQVKELARKGWTVTGIAAFFGVDRTTMHARYQTIIEDARQQGCGDILELLWTRAQQGSDKVLIHLADRILGPVPKEFKFTKEQAIKVLEDELNNGGIQPSAEGEGETDSES